MSRKFQRLASNLALWPGEEKVMTTRVALTMVLIGSLTAVSLAGTKKSKYMRDGNWGGQHIQMSVNKHSAHIEYDCANGTITGPLKIDSRGRFDLRGRHNVEHGGPARIDEKPGGEPAKYTGWTDGKKMKLTVTLVNSKTEIGTFELTRGNMGRVFKCR
jgi:hypothetical protein